MRAWISVALVVIATGAIRWRLLDVPLDRDEGEYAYMGHWLREGILPYASAYSMKLPGIYAVYAGLLKLFGETSSGIRLGLALVTSASTVCVFILGCRLLGPWPGVAAAATFATLTLSPAFLGLAANAEHFAVLPGLVGIIVLLSAARAGSIDAGSMSAGSVVSWLAAGILFGLAILIKQHAVCFLLFAVVFLGVSRALRALAFVVAGALVPVAAVAVWFASAGAFARLWFWTVSYALAYASIRSPADGLAVLPDVLGVMLPPCMASLALAAVGAVFTVWDRDLRPVARVLVPLTLVSLLSTSIGFYFRQQYFLLLIPALSLLTGVAVDELSHRLERRLGRLGVWAAAAVIVLALTHTVWAQRAILFRFGPAAIARAVYGGNPFPESVAVGRYLRERTAAGDRVVVMGSEPEIYFYANRPAGTRYIYMYPLFEPQPYAGAMQDELIRDVEAAAPRFVVYVNVPTSWLVSAAAPRRVLDWFDTYRDAHLEQVGLVDMLTPTLTMVYWDGQALGRTPRSNLWLAVYRRRD